jgi:hypothetical protein
MIDTKKPWAAGVALFAGFGYAGVITGNCYAKEPADLHPVPLGAAVVTGTAATTITVSAGATAAVTEFRPNMSGDDTIQVSKERGIVLQSQLW